MQFRKLGPQVCLLALLTASTPAGARVRSLTLGISTNCPYGGIAE